MSIQIIEKNSVIEAVNFALDTAEISHLCEHEDQPHFEFLGVDAYKVTGPNSAIVTATITMSDALERRTTINQTFRVNAPVVSTLREVAILKAAKQ
jgi:hypothetical protein